MQRKWNGLQDIFCYNAIARNCPEFGFDFVSRIATGGRNASGDCDAEQTKLWKNMRLVC